MTLPPFPDPLNEKAARVVAGAVALTGLLALITGWRWLLAVLAYGFIARALAGPRFSPLGRLASQMIAPRLGRARLVPGPPKRFAQAIGAVCTTAGAVFALALGWNTAADVVLVVISVLATLESVFALCVGCRIFSVLISLGVIPETVCERCVNLGGASSPAATRG